jgi:NitT/TauT family transport system ATP-binding protein
LTVPAVSLEEVTARFAGPGHAEYTAVESVTFDVAEGAFVSIVGPSGCGKSTLLAIAAGLLAPGAGETRIFGEPLRGVNRRATCMFQQEALLPWKTVLDNVTLSLTFRGIEERERTELGRRWLARVGLEDFADRFPYQLSGGMRKRVAMAQNWIADRDIVLMDEPFSALDIHTRQRMEGEVLNLWSGSNKTVLFVTHDLEEAIALSDEVLVLSAGPASRLVGRYPVDLPRPRNLIDIRTEPRFADLYRAIWTDLREEVLRSYARSRN